MAAEDSAKKKIGVLALQGDFEAHAKALARAGRRNALEEITGFVPAGRLNVGSSADPNAGDHSLQQRATLVVQFNLAHQIRALVISSWFTLSVHAMTVTRLVRVSYWRTGCPCESRTRPARTAPPPRLATGGGRRSDHGARSGNPG